MSTAGIRPDVTHPSAVPGTRPGAGTSIANTSVGGPVIPGALVALARQLARQAASEAFNAAAPLSTRTSHRSLPDDQSVSRLPRLLDVPAAANHLKLSTKTIRRMIERRELPAIRVGRQIRITEDDVLALIRQSWK